MSLEEEFRRVCSTPSDIVDHLRRFASAVITNNVQHVIELGTRTGVSTIAWLYALDKTGGRLTSVDLDSKPDIGDYPHWEFIQGDDCDPKVFAQLRPADIVFIDTSHFYEHTLRELHLYRHLVKPGGVLMLHDTQLHHPLGGPSSPAFPVRKAIGEFCESEGFRWDEFKDSWGLAVIKL